MSDDLRQLLHDTAPEPTRPLDATGVVRRARRQTFGLRGAAVAASLVLIGVAVVGLPRLWDDTGPQIADTPPEELVTAPIGVLDAPAGAGDELPGWATEELQIDPEAAATARLARRTPGRTFYLYADDTPTGPQALPGPAVCVAVLHDAGLETAQACGPRQVPSRRHAPVVMMSDVGTVGIAPDGIASARDVVDGGQLPDVPVVNNLFIDPAPPGNVALEGRSDQAFCAVAPMRESDPESLVDSDDPMRLLEQMATTAPAEIADDMYLVWDYLRLNPDAIQTHTVAFADHVERAANRVDDYIRSTCAEQPAPDATTAAEADLACRDTGPQQTTNGTVLVYFGCGYGPDPLRPVSRTAPEGGLSEQLQFVITQFAQGPTANEREQGYQSVLPGDPSYVLGVEHVPSEGTVVVSFDPRIREVNTLGTAGVSLPFVDGLRETALQFDGVQTLRLETNGECWPVDPYGRCTFRRDG